MIYTLSLVALLQYNYRLRVVSMRINVQTPNVSYLLYVDQTHSTRTGWWNCCIEYLVTVRGCDIVRGIIE